MKKITTFSPCCLQKIDQTHNGFETTQLWVCFPKNWSLHMFMIATAYVCMSPLAWSACCPAEAATDSGSLPGTWCTGCCSNTWGGSDRFNIVIALLNDVPGAAIKLQQLKPGLCRPGEGCSSSTNHCGVSRSTSAFLLPECSEGSCRAAAGDTGGRRLQHSPRHRPKAKTSLNMWKSVCVHLCEEHTEFFTSSSCCCARGAACLPGSP